MSACPQPEVIQFEECGYHHRTMVYSYIQSDQADSLKKPYDQTLKVKNPSYPTFGQLSGQGPTSAAGFIHMTLQGSSNDGKCGGSHNLEQGLLHHIRL